MLTAHPPLHNREGIRGSLRIIAVRQRHDRTGRVITLLDAESMGEIKTNFRKRQFSYFLDCVTDVDVKQGNWILSPREELGLILDVKNIGPWMSASNLIRVELRVRFNDTGSIRVNEEWYIYSHRPITRQLLVLWQNRMTDHAKRYYRQVLPTVIDSILHQPTDGIDGEQIKTICEIQEQILSHAIRLAETQQVIRLTSTQLVQATRDVLREITARQRQ